MTPAGSRPRADQSARGRPLPSPTHGCGRGPALGDDAHHARSSESRRGNPAFRRATKRRFLPSDCGVIEYVCDSQAGICTTWSETAAGHAVAAWEGDGGYRPVNREPTAWREPPLESPTSGGWRM